MSVSTIPTDELDAQIAQFEALIDNNDPEQVKMLKEMKRHTSLLKHGRGEWDDEAKTRGFRSYNEPGTALAAKRLPMDSTAYRNYKNHVIEESQSLLSIAKGEDVPRIMPRILPSEMGDGGEDVLSSRPELL